MSIYKCLCTNVYIQMSSQNYENVDDLCQTLKPTIVVKIKGDRKRFLTKLVNMDIQYETQENQEGQRVGQSNNTTTIRGVINLAKEVYRSCIIPARRYNLRETPQRQEYRRMRQVFANTNRLGKMRTMIDTKHSAPKTIHKMYNTRIKFPRNVKLEIENRLEKKLQNLDHRKLTKLCKIWNVSRHITNHDVIIKKISTAFIKDDVTKSEFFTMLS